MGKENMIARSKIGYIKLSDETMISLRVVIVDIREGMQKPVGPDLHIAHTTLIKADSPQSLKEKVREKPLPPPTNIHLQNLEIWEIVDIIESENAFDECKYTATNGHTYRAIVEIEPTIAARTLEYRDDLGNPIYHLRLGTKILTKMGE